MISCIFFFKQKTAYELRISDWSSDVCSSDLLKEYLTQISTSRSYNRFRDDIGYVLGKISELGPDALGAVKKIEKSIKGTLLKNSNLFEALKFRYFGRSEEHTSELQSLMRISYAVFCLKRKTHFGSCMSLRYDV